MLKKISKISKVLSKTEMSQIKAGISVSVTCTFSNGESWMGSTTSTIVGGDMTSYCRSQGGVASSVIRFD